MRATLFGCSALAALALTGCDDTLFLGEDGGGDVPTGNDFCAVNAVIENNCLDCHSAAAKVADYDLETDPYAALTEIGYYGIAPVIPGDPEGSLFYQKVTDTQPDDGSYGGVMPPGTSGVSAEEAEIIYEWIANGALEECVGGDTGDTGGTTDGGTTDGGTTDGGTTDGGTTDGGTTGAETEWEVVLGIFNAQCLGCHSAALAPTYSYLDLETDPYGAIVGVTSAQFSDKIHVVAGDPEGSFLYEKSVGIQGSGYGDSMPLGTTVSAGDAEVFYSWIANGATRDSPYTGGTGGGTTDGGTTDGGSTDGGTTDGGTTDGGTTGEASLWTEVQGLFNAQCLGCHSAVALSGGLDLETDPYGAIVNVQSAQAPIKTLVTPGSPADSLLYLKCTGTQEALCGDSMPPGSTVSAGDADLLYDWILAGAPND